MTELVACPEPDCRAPAEILDDWLLDSPDGPVPNVKTLCLGGHMFAMIAPAVVKPPWPST
jgi:hypothetical protein